MAADRVQLPDGTPVSEKWALLYRIAAVPPVSSAEEYLRRCITDLSRAEARIEKLERAMLAISLITEGEEELYSNEIEAVNGFIGNALNDEPLPPGIAQQMAAALALAAEEGKAAPPEDSNG